MYDVIVVGGRCAGAATALLLARKGYRVLVLERARFPADIPHGHFIQRQGPRLLHEWGVLDAVVRSGCPPVTTVTTDLGDFPLTGAGLVRDGIAFGYGPRRSKLDAILMDAAIASGAEFRDGFSVNEYLFDSGAITGIRGRSHGSDAVVTERARITIGADGRHSSLAQAAAAAVYEETPPLTCWYFSYWSGAALHGLEVYVRGRNAIFSFPTNDGLAAIFAIWDVAEFPRVRQNIENAFLDVIALVPDFEQRIRGGRREERFYGTVDVPNFFRKPYGPGWALVGDAGHHKDPFLALGICDAFRDADLLAAAIHEGFSGVRPLGDSMADYENRRNGASMQLYRENIYFAQFQPVPEQLLAIRRAVRSSQEDTNRFYMARNGMIPSESFFNPENLRRLISAGPGRVEAAGGQ